jgi:hypothetical protein
MSVNFFDTFLQKPNGSYGVAVRLNQQQREQPCLIEQAYDFT